MAHSASSHTLVLVVLTCRHFYTFCYERGHTNFVCSTIISCTTRGRLLLDPALHHLLSLCAASRRSLFQACRVCSWLFEHVGVHPFTFRCMCRLVEACQSARIHLNVFSDWRYWCRKHQLCGSPLLSTRSFSAGRKVLLVQQTKTKHSVRQQLQPPAITQGEILCQKEEEALYTRTVKKGSSITEDGAQSETRKHYFCRVVRNDAFRHQFADFLCQVLNFNFL